MMLLGAVLMLIQRAHDPEFFRRRPETFDPTSTAVLESQVEG